MSVRRLCRAAAIGLALAITFISPSRADDYPVHPVRIVVPFAPGGGTDLITRTLADIIATDWKAAVVIENKPGGGTTIAAQTVATAPADGYTLLATSNSFLVSPLLMPMPHHSGAQGFSRPLCCTYIFGSASVSNPYAQRPR